MYSTEYYVFILIIAAGLGLIPASIAKKKGYSFGLWWLYGWMIFIAAIIHVSLIPDKNAQPATVNRYATSSDTSQRVADELKKYKELLDEGIITEEEFRAKKEQLMKLM